MPVALPILRQSRRAFRCSSPSNRRSRRSQPRGAADETRAEDVAARPRRRRAAAGPAAGPCAWGDRVRSAAAGGVQLGLARPWVAVQVHARNAQAAAQAARVAARGRDGRRLAAPRDLDAARADRRAAVPNHAAVLVAGLAAAHALAAVAPAAGVVPARAAAVGPVPAAAPAASAVLDHDAAATAAGSVARAAAPGGLAILAAEVVQAAGAAAPGGLAVLAVAQAALAGAAAARVVPAVPDLGDCPAGSGASDPRRPRARRELQWQRQVLRLTLLR